MSYFKFLSFSFLIVIISHYSFGQTPDSTKSIQKGKIRLVEESKDTIPLFSGTQLAEKDSEYDSTGRLKLGVYVSSYYSHYTSPEESNGYEKFPTVSPRNNMFGLNLLQLSAKYHSRTLRSNITLHAGDIPTAAWSAKYNFIQEANIGLKVHNHLWFDLGFFRTHLGLESIQPRENATLSIAVPTYFEPYFLSGAKLTYQATEKLILQASVFNGFNTFIETNKNKTLGVSALYQEKNLSLTFNSLLTDETDISIHRKHTRLYNDAYFIYKHAKIHIGGEVNFGIQGNSKIGDSTKAALMFSAILSIKDIVTKKFSWYIRGEYYKDENGILCGTYVNTNRVLSGLETVGGTLGVEFKPIPNSYIRLESRIIESLNHYDAFVLQNKNSKFRDEILMGFGLWF